MVNFMDFYYTAPGTLAGQYMRKFWHPVFRAEDLKPGWANRSKSWANNLRFTAAMMARRTSSIFAAHTAKLSFPWVGSRAIVFAADFTVGNSIAQDSIEQPAEKESFAEKNSYSSCPTKNISS
jgi:hypothetical protein